MSQAKTIEILCSKCLKPNHTTIYTSINASHKSLKEDFLNNKLNKLNCSCGYQMKIQVPVLYHDIENQYAIWFSKQTYEPKYREVRNNYLMKAEVINNWDEFTTKILLFENNIITNPIKKLEMPIEINFKKYNNIDECIKDILHIYKIKEYRCPKCKEYDTNLGLGKNCSKCGKFTHTIETNKLFTSFVFLKVVNYYYNEFTYELAKNNIDKILNLILQTKNKKVNKKLVRNILHEIKIIGSEKMFIDFSVKTPKIYASGSLYGFYEICDSTNPDAIFNMIKIINGYIGFYLNYSFKQYLYSKLINSIE